MISIMLNMIDNLNSCFAKPLLEAVRDDPQLRNLLSGSSDAAN